MRHIFAVSTNKNQRKIFLFLLFFSCQIFFSQLFLMQLARIFYAKKKLPNNSYQKKGKAEEKEQRLNWKKCRKKNKDLKTYYLQIFIYFWRKLKKLKKYKKKKANYTLNIQPNRCHFAPLNSSRRWRLLWPPPRRQCFSADTCCLFSKVLFEASNKFITPPLKHNKRSV